MLRASLLSKLLKLMMTPNILLLLLFRRTRFTSAFVTFLGQRLTYFVPLNLVNSLFLVSRGIFLQLGNSAMNRGLLRRLLIRRRSLIRVLLLLSVLILVVKLLFLKFPVL